MARLPSRWVSLFSMAALSGCARGEKSPATRGEGVFLRSCAGCHGGNARGTHPPGFTVAPKDLTAPELQVRLTDDLLRDTIRYGKGQMPPFGAALAEEDVRDVIAYVRSLRRSPRPAE